MTKKVNFLKLNKFFITTYTPAFKPKRGKKYKLYSKNIFIYLYFLSKELTRIKSNHKLKFFVKPIKVKRFVILRAPYRYKLARLQLAFKHYCVNVCFKFEVSSYTDVDGCNLTSLANMIREVSEPYNTVFCKLYKVRTAFECKFLKNFFLKNYT